MYKKVVKLVVFNKLMGKNSPSFKLQATIILGLIVLLAEICLASAEPSYIFRQNTLIDLKVPCYAENYSLCTSTTTCNITIFLPVNNSALVNNQQMTWNDAYFNYTLLKNKTLILGEYSSSVNCFGAYYGFSTFNFKITPDGTEPTTAQGWVSIGILLSIILLTFFFGFLAFKFSEYYKLYPFAIFFLLVAILSSVYVLYLGYIYGRDYLYSTTAKPQEAMFIGVMYGLVGIMFIALIFFILKALAEIRERKSIMKYGEGYNPKTKSYEY